LPHLKETGFRTRHNQGIQEFSVNHLREEHYDDYQRVSGEATKKVKKNEEIICGKAQIILVISKVNITL